MLVGWSIGWSIHPLVGPSVPISLRKLIMSQLLHAWGLVTTLFFKIFIEMSCFPYRILENDKQNLSKNEKEKKIVLYLKEDSL
jgi:hypothetical protein